MLGALIPWPGAFRRALASVLPSDELRRALVLDARFMRPLRALGHTVVLYDLGPRPPDGEPMRLLCAKVPSRDASDDLIALCRQYAGWLPQGGIVVLRGTASDRQRIGAALLHAGLCDIRQARIGRGYLTAGLVARD